MIRLTRSQLQPIGIDIGHDAIKMIQLEVSDGSLAVRGAASEEFSAEVRARPELRPAVCADLIRRMLKEGGFSGRRAVVALPREILQIKNFRLPAMSASELESAVLLESRQLFDFDIDAAHVQFLSAGEVRQGSDVLQEEIVLGARGEDVDNFVEQMHRCGLVLDSLDAEPCALFRSVERFIRRREDEQEVHVLVDVGFSGSQVVIGKGRDISFLKTIDIGGHHLNEAVARKLGISYEEAVGLRRRLGQENDDRQKATGRDGSQDDSLGADAVRQAVFDASRGVMEQLGRELSLCLRYQSVTFRGHRPTRLRLLGGESRDPRLQSVLATIVTIPVEAGRPLLSVDASRMQVEHRRGGAGEWAVALGLGLKRTSGRFGLRDGRPRGTPMPAADTDPQDDLPPGELARGETAQTAALGTRHSAPGVAAQEEASHA